MMLSKEDKQVGTQTETVDKVLIEMGIPLMILRLKIYKVLTLV